MNSALRASATNDKRALQANDQLSEFEFEAGTLGAQSSAGSAVATIGSIMIAVLASTMMLV